MRNRDDSGPEKDSVEQLLDDYTARQITRRDFFKRSAALGITVSVAGALLAACGGDDEEARSARGGGASGRDAAGRHSRGRRAAGRGAEPASRSRAGSSSRATTATSRGWTRSSPTGPIRPTSPSTSSRSSAMRTVPTSLALVDSWEISEDLLTWTFMIREGLTFQSGAPARRAGDRRQLQRVPGCHRRRRRARAERDLLGHGRRRAGSRRDDGRRAP